MKRVHIVQVCIIQYMHRGLCVSLRSLTWPATQEAFCSVSPMVHVCVCVCVCVCMCVYMCVCVCICVCVCSCMSALCEAYRYIHACVTVAWTQLTEEPYQVESGLPSHAEERGSS